MKKILLLILSLITFYSYSRSGCYSFNRGEPISLKKLFPKNNTRCYDFNTGSHNRIGALKLGIGMMPFMLMDEYGVNITTLMMEIDLGDWGGGIQADYRVGNTYINTTILSSVAPMSIDSRIYGYGKLKNKNLSVGGYGQINSTSMWVDGFVLGSLLRWSKDFDYFGFFGQMNVPIWNIQKRAINLYDIDKNTYWFGMSGNKNFKPVRPTEYRFIVGIYFILEHKIYPFKRKR